MKNIQLSAVLLLLAAPSLFAQQEEKDIPGAKDHPLFTRLSGFVITKYEEKDFDRAEMPVAADDPKWLIWKELEGKVTRITYRAKKDVKVTELQVARNYLNAAKNAGGEIVFDGDG
ncbi:MAG: hypothetical protein RML35_12930 [Chloroherpetonaceae bacterium]|nr:hypothetical protein [Chloroherpetonaceae bacterium]